MRSWSVFSVLVIWAMLNAQGAFGAEKAAPQWYDYRIVNTYEHDPKAYTQGLYVEDGVFYESTGVRGASSLRRVEIETGDVLKKIDLPDRFFGEGIATLGDRIFLLTWQSGVGFVFDKTDFKRVDQFDIEGEGWGLTHNGEHLIMSDGSANLMYLDPNTLKVVRRVPVTYLGRPVRSLNELEWINGEIYANIYTTNQIVRIDPKTGDVTGVIVLDGLLSEEDRGGAEVNVLNGIAFDETTGRLFVTGKLWPKLYEIELVPR